MQTNDWNQYRKLILHEMKENGKKINDLMEIVIKLREDVSALRVKAAIAGGMAGMVGTALLSVLIRLWK